MTRPVDAMAERLRKPHAQSFVIELGRSRTTPDGLELEAVYREHRHKTSGGATAFHDLELTHRGKKEKLFFATSSGFPYVFVEGLAHGYVVTLESKKPVKGQAKPRYQVWLTPVTAAHRKVQATLRQSMKGHEYAEARVRKAVKKYGRHVDRAKTVSIDGGVLKACYTKGNMRLCWFNLGAYSGRVGIDKYELR